MIRRHLISLSAIPFLILAGCFAVPDSAEVPDVPTWNNSVQEVLANHCVVCHGDPPNRGAPDYFRLDVYATTDAKAGAADMAATVYEEASGGDMPPGIGAELGPNDLEILSRWLDNGTPLE